MYKYLTAFYLYRHYVRAFSLCNRMILRYRYASGFRLLRPYYRNRKGIPKLFYRYTSYRPFLLLSIVRIFALSSL